MRLIVRWISRSSGHQDFPRMSHRIGLRMFMEIQIFLNTIKETEIKLRFILLCKCYSITRTLYIHIYYAYSVYF